MTCISSPFNIMRRLNKMLRLREQQFDLEVASLCLNKVLFVHPQLNGCPSIHSIESKLFLRHYKKSCDNENNICEKICLNDVWVIPIIRQQTNKVI